MYRLNRKTTLFDNSEIKFNSSIGILCLFGDDKQVFLGCLWYKHGLFCLASGLLSIQMPLPGFRE